MRRGYARVSDDNKGSVDGLCAQRRLPRAAIRTKLLMSLPPRQLIILMTNGSRADFE